MPISRLTKRQAEVLEFIKSSAGANGFPPTSRDIAERFEFRSQTAAMNHLRALRKKGFLDHWYRKARAHAKASTPALLR